MKPVRNLFLLSTFTKLPLTNSGALSAVQDGAREGASLFPSSQTSRGVGTTIQTAPSPGNVAKSSIRGAAGKATCTFSGPGLCRERDGATLLQGSTNPSAALGPACARGLAALPRVLCLMARGEVLEPGKVHARSCRGGWCSGVPKKEPYHSLTPGLFSCHGLSSKACLPQGTQRAR